MQKALLAFLIFINFHAVAQPNIKGGIESFIKAHLVYPSYSLHNCIQGKIVLSFQLTTKGQVYNSQVKSGIGTDLDKEALRLLRLSSGKWNIVSTFDTTIVLLLPVKFSLQGYNCLNRSKAEIQRAIDSYEAQEGLAIAIQNFYKNKAAGNYTKDEEIIFLKLKEELGFDQAFMEEKIKKGREKLKQKDKLGACEDFYFVRNMGFDLAESLINQYCK